MTPRILRPLVLPEPFQIGPYLHVAREAVRHNEEICDLVLSAQQNALVAANSERYVIPVTAQLPQDPMFARYVSGNELYDNTNNQLIQSESELYVVSLTPELEGIINSY